MPQDDACAILTTRGEVLHVLPWPRTVRVGTAFSLMDASCMAVLALGSREMHTPEARFLVSSALREYEFEHFNDEKDV